MVKIMSNVDDRRNLEYFMERLKSHGLLKGSDSLLYHEGGQGYSLSYWTAEKQRVHNQTKVDLQLDGQVGYILSLTVYSENRLRGIGTKLVDCLGDLAREGDASSLVTTSTGKHKMFFSAIGFVPLVDGVQYEREL